jgi:hypothetical protein
MLTARQVGGLDGNKMYDGPVISIASVGKIQPEIPNSSTPIKLENDGADLPLGSPEDSSIPPSSTSL